MRGVSRNPAPDARAAPPEAHESLISRKTGAEVPLTGLSLLVHALCDTPCSRCQTPFGAAIGLRRKVGQRRFHPPRPRPTLGAQEACFPDICAGFPVFVGPTRFFRRLPPFGGGGAIGGELHFKRLGGAGPRRHRHRRRGVGSSPPPVVIAREVPRLPPGASCQINKKPRAKARGFRA